MKKFTRITTHPHLRDLNNIKKDWFSKYNQYGFKENAFVINKQESALDNNTTINFPYLIEKPNGQTYMEHIILHTRKGWWWFKEQNGEFKCSIFDYQKLKTEEWYIAIDKLLFKVSGN